uniref:Sulfatase domain-containing protein n=1 Tax=Parastrongyloides trichosuri TaxID=131310 RepID=A0A0N4ZJB5_PARTI
MYNVVNNDPVLMNINYTEYKSLIGSTYCKLPNLDPWDPSIKSYIYKVDDLKCKNIQPELTYLSNGLLLINGSEIENSSIDVNSLTPQYRCIERGEDDFTLNTSSWILFKNGTKIECEFIEVRILQSYLQLNIYSNHHYQIIPKEEKNISNKTKKPNVIIIVLDSISHSNFIRKLPKTLSVLENDYKSVILNGMTKVGDNSFPNAVAFLSGKRSSISGYKDEIDNKKYFDYLPLIWNNFEEEGYKTFYAEDYTDYNLFTYLAKGFKKQPTTHYFRPFWYSVYKSWLLKRSTYLCYGNNKMHNIQLEYLNHFLRAYPNDVPLFALSWFTEIGHDYINQVEIVDNDLRKFLVKNKQKLDDSFLFILGDHGHRFDSIRKTTIGRLEERLPFFSISIPKSLYEETNIMGTVKNNSNVLTSFWDFYVTLRDIIKIESLLKENNSIKGIYNVRGESLLRPIKDRNCEEASIPEEFCPCQEEISLKRDDKIFTLLGDILINHLNTLLFNHLKLCSKLSLKKIHNVEMIIPNNYFVEKPNYFLSFFYHNNNNNNRDNNKKEEIRFRATIETSPGDGIFEGTFKQNNKKSYEVIGDINRINRYGNQSVCVDNQILRKFCYCYIL